MTKSTNNHRNNSNQTLGEKLLSRILTNGLGIRKPEELSDKLVSFLGGSSVVPQLAKAIQSFVCWSQAVDALNVTGWLPFRTVPLRYIVEHRSDSSQLDFCLSEYYTTEWNSIRHDMILHLDCCQIDDEARAAFREALIAHELELYRCVCRVLLPEIERVIGGGHSKKLLDKLAGTQSLEHISFQERFDYVICGQLINHVYNSSKLRKELRENPVPNRHAASHGLVSYSSHKHSMNMLIFADYIFRVVTTENGSET